MTFIGRSFNWSCARLCEIRAERAVRMRARFLVSFCPAFFQPPQTANCVWTVVCERVPPSDRTAALSRCALAFVRSQSSYMPLSHTAKRRCFQASSSFVFLRIRSVCCAREIYTWSFFKRNTRLWPGYIASDMWRTE